MRVFFPGNLERSEGNVYGWVNEFNGDIFVCSFRKPKWFKKLSVLKIRREPYQFILVCRQPLISLIVKS